MRAEERRGQAVEAAIGVAGELGIRPGRSRILKDSHNTIVHLAPAPIVAKVGTSHFRDAQVESLERELAVATHLAERGAPIVPPAEDVPPGPHSWKDVILTLWQHAEPDEGAILDPVRLTGALRTVHETLGDFPASLPPFSLELEDARRLLEPDRSPALPLHDRRFLLTVLEDVQAAVSAMVVPNRPLHGSPHERNWVATAEGPLLLDFETAAAVRSSGMWPLSVMRPWSSFPASNTSGSRCCGECGASASPPRCSKPSARGVRGCARSSEAASG
jgi:hypothetical protein